MRIFEKKIGRTKRDGLRLREKWVRRFSRSANRFSGDPGGFGNIQWFQGNLCRPILFGLSVKDRMRKNIAAFRGDKHRAEC